MAAPEAGCIPYPWPCGYFALPVSLYISQIRSCPALTLSRLYSLRVIGKDGTVFTYKIIDKCIGKFQISRVLLNVIKFQNGLDHAAINIVPGKVLPLPDLFDIPDRCLRAAFSKS